MNDTPFNNKKSPKDWAPAKVRLLVPNCPEKKTLIAMADSANPNGENIWPCIATIAHRSCQSERTVQRHIKKLVELGYLVRQVEGGKGPKDTSQYWIPICKMSDEQWEEYKQCSKRQIRIPFPQAKGDMVSPKGVMVSPLKGDMVSPNLSPFKNLKNRSGDTQNLKDALRAKLSASHGSNSVAILDEPNKPKAIAFEESDVRQFPPEIENFAVSMSAETKAEWDALLVKLSVADAPVGIGQHARTAIYGTNEVNPDTEMHPAPIVEPEAL